MDSFLNELTNEQFMSTVMEYAQRSRFCQVNIFVEGEEDSILYLSIIERHMRSVEKSVSFVCKGKKRVYQVYDYIEKNYTKSDSEIRLYFVDKDLSDILPDDPTPLLEYFYITENYSIENDIATEDMARKFIRELYKITGPINSEELFDMYVNFRSKVDIVIQKIMSWIIFQRKKGFKPTLRGIDLSDIITFDEFLHPIDDEIALQRFAANFPNAISYTESDIESEFASLDSISLKKWMRGKYDIWAFSTFFKKIPGYIKTNGGILKEVVPLGGKSFIYHMLPRYIPLNSLEHFIKLHVKEYN